MATLEYFVVVESVSIAQFSNRISLFNVIEELTPPAFPTVFPQMVAVSAWNSEAGDDQRDLQVMLRVTLSNGTQLPDFTQNLRFPQRRHRVLSTLEGVPIPAAGQLRFEVFLNGERKASHTVDVSHRAD